MRNFNQGVSSSRKPLKVPCHFWVLQHSVPHYFLRVVVVVMTREMSLNQTLMATTHSLVLVGMEH